MHRRHSPLVSFLPMVPLLSLPEEALRHNSEPRCQRRKKKKKHWEMTESRLNNISICWSIETGKNGQKLLRICENWHLSQYPTWMMELALCTCVWESTAYLVGFCGGTPHAGYWKWWWHCGQHWSDHSESIVPHLGATGFEKEPSYTITSLGTSPVWWVPWSMASDRGTLVWKVED